MQQNKMKAVIVLGSSGTADLQGRSDSHAKQQYQNYSECNFTVHVYICIHTYIYICTNEYM